LRAREQEELNVISACLQGSITCYGEMEFDKEHERFAAIMVRYSWEDVATRKTNRNYVILKHIRTAFRIECVKKLSLRGIDLTQENKLLELVTVSARIKKEKIFLHLIFSDSGEIYAEVEDLDVRMEDLGDAIDSQIKVVL